MHFLLFNIQFSESAIAIANHIENRLGRGYIYKFLCKIIFYIFPPTVNASVKIAENGGLSDLKSNSNLQCLLPYRDTEHVKNQQLVVFERYYSKDIVTTEDVLYLNGRLLNGYTIILHTTPSEKTYITAVCLLSIVLNLYSVDMILGIIRGIIPNFTMSTTSLFKAQCIIDRTRNIRTLHSELCKVKLGNRIENGDYRKSQA